ncbi:porin family protein [Antarcticibacterium flavum]|uniref:Porin family protein n=1 Tax=Antarcticibacterium flavum TaxID=2058175 RepID=A0A5B7X5K2_9FLAO|nr:MULTISPECIES: outer membrane beta-barrel protein [Antarcticibacterium]MCM4161555.1 opacity protein [Antarcticibacterium sp. W02-3]QCY69992.1 porin family protein [Antarcticibacterium flavum]
MKELKFLLAGIIILVFTNAGLAQERWTAEFRPGVNFPIDKVAGIEVKTGFGFEAALSYEIIPHLEAYAGWSWNKFGGDSGFGPSNLDVEETGYTFGFQFIHPIANSSLSYSLRGGAVYNHLEFEDQGGNTIVDSGHGFGWQVGGGLDWEIGNNFHLRPGIRYRSLTRQLEMEIGNLEAKLNYLSFGLGLAKRF